MLQVHPSLHCNLSCEHCYTSSGPKLRGELPVELLRAAIDDASALGYRQLAVSGGEPLLYRDLRALLEHARARDMITSVTTNAMLASAERWSAIAPLVDVVAVSIDGVEADHDRIRGQRGAFAKTLEHLPILRESGCSFGFLFTLTQYNVDSLEAVVVLAKQHGASSVQVHPLTLEGRAKQQMGDARPDELELVAAIVEAHRLGELHGLRVHVDALTLDQIAAHRDELVPSRPVRSMTQICPVLTIGADGTVTPLTHDVSRAYGLGSLFEDRLANLASAWLDRGRADALGGVCERTWDELVSARTAHASYWYDEIAARSHALSVL